MHIADFSLNMLGANGIVGAGIAPATGAALASKLRGTDQVSVCFFGDGARCTRYFSRGHRAWGFVEAPRCLRLREQPVSAVGAAA